MTPEATKHLMRLFPLPFLVYYITISYALLRTIACAGQDWGGLCNLIVVGGPCKCGPSLARVFAARRVCKLHTCKDQLPDLPFIVGLCDTKPP